MTANRAGSLVVVGVPEDCICAPEADAPAFGTELAPAALRMSGLTEATGAADDGDLPVRLVGTTRDVSTGVLGWPSVLQLTATVRDKVRDLVGEGAVPLLAGGCCMLLPGALAGARDALGAVGLPISTDTWTCTTGARRPQARPPTCQSRLSPASARPPGLRRLGHL